MLGVKISVSAVVAFAVATFTFPCTAAHDDPSFLPHAAANLNSLDFRNSHKLITRSEWGGKASLGSQELEHPVDLVILAHTATRFCKSVSDCSKIVKSAQGYHLDLGFPDIKYNFLVGGDGNVYEGRGWDYVSSQRNQSISVSFIGNYLHDYLSEDMIDALQELLNEGVELGKLKENYKIVCHNQTTATLSPGVHVYEVVATWSHFQPEKLF